MSEARNVLVIGEISCDGVQSSTLEMMNIGRSLAADLGEELTLVVLGSDLGEIANDCLKYGVDKVYAVEHPLLEQAQIDLHLEALTSLCRAIAPNAVIVGRTSLGRELAPRLAFRLGVGLAQDALSVTVDADTKRLIVNRPVYGGNAMAIVCCNQNPQVVSIRPKVYKALKQLATEECTGEVVPFAVELDSSMVKVKTLNVVKEESKGIKLEDARIVVAGGRGLGTPDAFKQLEVLSELLSAGLGASRAVVDSGWVPQSMQIGLTGKSISPELYITVAISGASQHMAGCSGSKVIVAINKDSAANIFKEARYGVVGDWSKVLPAFTETIRELMAN